MLSRIVTLFVCLADIPLGRAPYDTHMDLLLCFFVSFRARRICDKLKERCTSLRRPPMESMEEFDRESPMVMTFCQLLSEDEFEEQGLSYTERALRDLFLTMERQPELCERVVRRRKQAELERGAVGTAIRAKFFSAVEGQMNRCNAVGGQELRQHVARLREEMEKVQLYAQEAKHAARRTSRRLQDRKRKMQDGGAPAVCPPPPPPAPPLPPSTPQPGAQTPLRDQANVRRGEFQVAATPDLLDSYGLSRLNRPGRSCVDPPAPPDLGDPHADIRTAILACNPLKRLKATGIERSPGGTPICTPRRSRLAGGQESSPASAFNTALLSKFRSAQSPAPGAPPADSPGSSCSDGSGFTTPPGSP
ncbi:uncharacterized protein [Lepisosteus oculatus]|uniref:uncharacterized protein isoform X2 n=1 Tax=Lepisosteus oculatus TaxID=7918 RepID=UPI0035F51528